MARISPDVVYDVLSSLMPGDKVKIVFADRTYSDHLTSRINALLEVAHTEVDFGAEVMALCAVADRGAWNGFLEYTITLEYDFFLNLSKWFVWVHEMCESIEKI